jgi:phosphohistidine phosphatase
MTGVKNILLLRHAKSAWNIPHQSDHDRALNDRGERAAKTMAAHTAAKAPRPDLILCSTAARTRQTLAPLVKALGSPTPPISLEKQLYLASESELLERLQALPEDVETVLLIGHNEGIGEFAAALAAQAPAGQVSHRSPGHACSSPGPLERSGPRNLRASGLRPAARSGPALTPQ